MVRGETKIAKQNLVGNINAGNQLRDLDVAEWILLKCVLNKHSVKASYCFMFSGGLL